jgi:glycerol kinase
VIQWLRDYMKIVTSSSESEEMARSVTKDDEVVIVPAFVGLGAPYWKSDARGAIFGITRDTSREQIVRAALKSIAFQTFDIIEAMQQDSGMLIRELRVDGGATMNNYLMQFQSDILEIPVLLPEITESTALGAAYLAGLTAGIYGSINEVAHYNRISRRYAPQMADEERMKQRRLWKDAINRILL